MLAVAGRGCVRGSSVRGWCSVTGGLALTRHQRVLKFIQHHHTAPPHTTMQHTTVAKTLNQQQCTWLPAGPGVE